MTEKRICFWLAVVLLLLSVPGFAQSASPAATAPQPVASDSSLAPSAGPLVSSQTSVDIQQQLIDGILAPGPKPAATCTLPCSVVTYFTDATKTTSCGHQNSCSCPPSGSGCVTPYYTVVTLHFCAC